MKNKNLPEGWFSASKAESKADDRTDVNPSTSSGVTDHASFTKSMRAGAGSPLLAGFVGVARWIYPRAGKVVLRNPNCIPHSGHLRIRPLCPVGQSAPNGVSPPNTLTGTRATIVLSNLGEKKSLKTMKNKTLPEGWFPASEAESKAFWDELQKELPQGHLLFRVDVEVVAHRDGATDDVLVRHVNEPERYTVVHLTWSSRQEGDASHPSVEVDGCWADFLAYERGW